MAWEKAIDVDLTPADMGDPYIAFRASDGRLFSSRDKPLRCTDTLIGSQAYTGRTPPLSAVNTVKLGDCHASADFVLGYAKITSAGSGWHGITPDDRWFSAGGSFLAYMSASGSFGRATAMMVYSFLIVSGEVFVEEQITVSQYADSGGTPVNVPSFTLNYHLWCCSFD